MLGAHCLPAPHQRATAERSSCRRIGDQPKRIAVKPIGTKKKHYVSSHERVRHQNVSLHDVLR
eukprot:CAMPEP_0119336406 /NCGR_PEP_ID=MMETSP1333-20130426/91733_1 /TAXON_ID=418940 /ORGANISM="Scyphosphaera apsteinii, Strain RCC1455" /LENGTH=62 /DNA_ID=CAMNT_0007347205 /DNA_START=1 /DNA_END=186 /DNA_ORIENTATION=+